MSSHETIRKRAREFAENEIKPVAPEYDTTGDYPNAVVKTAAEQGFVGQQLPEEYGGAGLDLHSAIVTVEEFSRVDHSFSYSIGAADVGMHLVNLYGDEWMKEKWMPKITAGESFSAMGITEPDHGSDIAGIETTAEKEDETWVIDGEKMWVTNGTIADVYIVAAKSAPGEGHKGISFFLVPGDNDGIETVDISGKMMGLRATDMARVSFDDVRIPETHLVGEENKGFYHLMEGFVSTRVNAAAGALGMAQGATDAAVEYANERTQFDQQISEYQAIQHKIAEIVTSVEAMRSVVYRAAKAIEEGRDGAKQLASAAKVFASDEVIEVTDKALQIHGSAGYLSDYPVERHYRNARVVKIYEGTNEIQKDVIASAALD